MNSSTMNEAIAEAIDEPMTEAIDTDVNEETSALNAKQRFPWMFGKPFRFIVGPIRESFFLSPALVENAGSLALNRMIKGPFMESNKREVDMQDDDDIDVDSFACFVNWLHYDRYCNKEIVNPPPSALSKEYEGLHRFYCQVCGNPKVSAKVPLWLYPSCTQKCHRLVGKSDTSHCAKCNKPFHAHNHTTLCETCFKEQDNYIPRESWNSIETAFIQLREPLQSFHGCGIVGKSDPRLPDRMAMVDHAKVYVLADKYGIPKLRGKSLCGLHAEMCELRCGDGWFADEDLKKLMELLYYVCEKTVALPEEDRELAVTMRGLLYTYVHWNYNSVCKGDMWPDFIKANSEFSWKGIARRYDVNRGRFTGSRTAMSVDANDKIARRTTL